VPITRCGLDYDERSSHTSDIRQHYMFLLETLDTKCTELVDHLYSDNVLTPMEVEDIIAEKTSFRANEKLLSVLSRKSPQQFQLFLDALDNCGQQHVRDVIDDRQGFALLTHSRTSISLFFTTMAYLRWGTGEHVPTLPRSGWVVRFAQIQRVFWRSRVGVADSV